MGSPASGGGRTPAPKGTGSERSPGAKSPDSYIFPRVPSEVHRLDLQHYALFEAIGTNHLAPVGEPLRVLDSGTGSGQWAFDVGKDFPNALVVGVDLERSKPGAPGNCRFVRCNVISGLPFPDDCFDFVHQRLLYSGIPVASWSALLDDLVRVTSPGGWVELVEGGNAIAPSGPATARLVGLLQQLAQSSGLDVEGVISSGLGRHLQRLGMGDIRTRRVEMSVGEWGGRSGSFMASNVSAMFTRLAPAFAARLGVPTEDCLDLVRTMRQECEQRHSTYRITFAYGRKR